MARPRLIEPVIRLCAVISGTKETYDWGLEKLIEHWGPIAIESSPIAFHAGGFYEEQMGPHLSKVLVAFERFADPADLADWKLQTNQWEQDCAKQCSTPIATNEAATRRRPINLDAGYLSQAKLVLATVKDRDHRVYLREGIFAEVTLNYVGNRWTHHRWSYPSYRTDQVTEFAGLCRARLREHLIATGQVRRVAPGAGRRGE